MTELAFAVVDIQPEPYAAAPQLTARLRLTEATGTAVHAIALRCQVRILPQRRGYAEEEEAGLLDLFGERGRWPNTLKSFLWMQCSTMVQGFTGSTEVDLPLPVHLRLRRRRRQVPAMPCGTARSRWSSCSPARSSPRARPGSGWSRFPGTSRLPTGFPCPPGSG